jgi:hypothetical protein
VLAFWLGVYIYFMQSSDWREIQALVAQNPEIQTKVGKIKEITLGPFPFMYRFSGDAAEATLCITAIGDAGKYRATIDFEKINGKWSPSRT